MDAITGVEVKTGTIVRRERRPMQRTKAAYVFGCDAVTRLEPHPSHVMPPPMRDGKEVMEIELDVIDLGNGEEVERLASNAPIGHRVPVVVGRMY